MAGSTGLEPATSGVTGQRSNQLNYDPDKQITTNKSQLTSLNAGEPGPLVGGTGLEPVTAGV
jgi:hypothetical protein